MFGSLKRNVLVYSEPTDMRKSYDGLASLVRNRDYLNGDIFLFISKDRKRAKALFWDGSGMNIWMKRLEKGRFADMYKRGWITASELKVFFEGSKVARRRISPDDMTHRFAQPR